MGPRGIPPVRPLAELEHELLGRVMQTTAKLEREVAKLAENDAFQNAQSSRIEAEVAVLSGQTRDLALIKKIAIGILSMMVPTLIGAAVTGIQAEQRLRILEDRVVQYVEYSEASAHDLGQVRTDVRLVMAELERQKQAEAEQLARVLERLEKIESNQGRRRR